MSEGSKICLNELMKIELCCGLKGLESSFDVLLMILLFSLSCPEILPYLNIILSSSLNGLSHIL